MSRRFPVSVGVDFAAVLSFLQERSIVPESPHSSMVGNAKRLHRSTYALILWKFRLKGLTEHARVFVEEVASDALQVLPQSLMGYGKTAQLLTRGIIENVVRHIYFADHPIEYARMNREHKWYIGTDELFDYLFNHPALVEAEEKFDAVQKLKSLYIDLSAGVHGRRVQDLEMRTALHKIVYSETAFEKQVVVTEKVSAAANFVLAVFHQSQMSGFQLEDRQIILRVMPAAARAVWRDLAN